MIVLNTDLEEGDSFKDAKCDVRPSWKSPTTQPPCKIHINLRSQEDHMGTSVRRSSGRHSGGRLLAMT